MTQVRLNNLGYRYDGASEDTLRGIDLVIAHGKPHALLGASGAGKTTLLNLLSGLLSPTAGQILFDARDVSRLRARERNVALVFQFPVLYEGKSILENLMFPLLTRGQSKKEATRRATELAEELDLSDVLNERPIGLPLFQKQLAAIGKSLVRKDVDLVLLDEPLTAVEPSTKWQLRQTLLNIQKNHELTMVYVTHDQTEALTFAEEVSVLSGGQILQTDSPADIYNRPSSKTVGHFIGSPGMSFVACTVSQGQVWIADTLIGQTDITDGHYEVGVRPDWLTPIRQTGKWQVTDTVLRGTKGGQASQLLTVSTGTESIQVDTVGDWALGVGIDLAFDQFVLFDGEQAVGHHG